MGQRDGSTDKVATTKSNDLSSILRTHTSEELTSVKLSSD